MLRTTDISVLKAQAHGQTPDGFSQSLEESDTEMVEVFKFCDELLESGAHQHMTGEQVAKLREYRYLLLGTAAKLREVLDLIK